MGSSAPEQHWCFTVMSTHTHTKIKHIIHAPMFYSKHKYKYEPARMHKIIHAYTCAHYISGFFSSLSLSLTHSPHLNTLHTYPPTPTPTHAFLCQFLFSSTNLIMLDCNNLNCNWDWHTIEEIDWALFLSLTFASTHLHLYTHTGSEESAHSYAHTHIHMHRKRLHTCMCMNMKIYIYKHTSLAPQVLTSGRVL